MCFRVCPNNLRVHEGIIEAKKGKLEKLAEIYELCIGCGRCEVECSTKLPIIRMLTTAGTSGNEKYKIRVGRGPIQDIEIRNVGASIVLGEIPGVIAFAGCPNYPRSTKDIVEMRKYSFRLRLFLEVGYQWNSNLTKLTK